MNQTCPAVDQHKQQQFERQRDRHRRNHHHAHGQEDIGNKDVESNKIVDEHLRGYVFNERVIRHAQVVVSK